MVTEVRPAILALMGSTIFLLLIASAKVANLLLVRASVLRIVDSSSLDSDTKRYYCKRMESAGQH